MRGQLTGRLLVIIFSWVGLIAILLLGILFSYLSGHPATPTASGVTLPFMQTTIHSYLYQTVDAGYGNNIPFAEYIVGEYLQGRTANVETQTNTFLSKLPATKEKAIFIFVDNAVLNADKQGGIFSWLHVGSNAFFTPEQTATASFSLPDGRTIRVQYLEKDS